MSDLANNPAEVIQTLDRILDHEVSLVLYGRGSLCLGFDNALPDFYATQDIDGIIRLKELDDLVNDDAFWDAMEQANKLLESKGLYITHLFQEDQVFLRPDWEQFIVRHDHITTGQMEPAFAAVRMPDIQELRDAFGRALPVVREILQRNA